MLRIKRIISVIILIPLITLTIYQPVPIFAADNTGTLKIFSETKGIKVFVDEELKGVDVMEIKNIEPGDHYVKVTKDNEVLYSELVKVSPSTTSAILIKSKGPSKEQAQQVEGAQYKQQQEYKQEKLDILLSKGMQTVGSSYTSSSYYPGYYSIFGSGWTTSSSTAYETTDWKIIKGGVQEISDSEFASLIGDKDTLARMNKAWEDYNNNTTIGAVLALVGVIMVLVGGSAAFSNDKAASESGAVIFAIGCLPTIIGWAMLSENPPSGHYISPGEAAKKAYEYNQSLKKKLGLPESYEPK